MKNEWYEYERWILRRIHFRKRGYETLLKHLHDTSFLWNEDFLRDEDRVSDGLFLRRQYLDGEDKLFPIDCSVLEMLAAFAIRIDLEYIGIPGEPHPDILFWEMIKNLGLGRQDNFRYDQNAVDRILRRWMYREYAENGRGSITPVQNPRRDHRKIDIWSQMMEYVSENYA